jgi:hypothetical protein
MIRLRGCAYLLCNTGASGHFSGPPTSTETINHGRRHTVSRVIYIFETDSTTYVLPQLPKTSVYRRDFEYLAVMTADALPRSTQLLRVSTFQSAFFENQNTMHRLALTPGKYRRRRQFPAPTQNGTKRSYCKCLPSSCRSTTLLIHALLQ